MNEKQKRFNYKVKSLTNKYSKKSKTKILLFSISFILFVFYGCSGNKLEKVDVNSIKEKTKDIKKEDLDKLKKN